MGTHTMGKPLLEGCLEDISLDAANYLKALEKAKQNKLDPSANVDSEEENRLLALVRACCQEDPKARASAADLLNHPTIAKHMHDNTSSAVEFEDSVGFYVVDAERRAKDQKMGGVGRMR